MDVVSDKKNPNHIPNQGESINKNSNLDMVPVGASMITFNGLIGLVSQSQPSQYYSMIV